MYRLAVGRENWHDELLTTSSDTVEVEIMSCILKLSFIHTKNGFIQSRDKLSGWF